MKDSARVIILLKITTDGHKASCGFSATAELLVTNPLVAQVLYHKCCKPMNNLSKYNAI